MLIYLGENEKITSNVIKRCSLSSKKRLKGKFWCAIDYWLHDGADGSSSSKDKPCNGSYVYGDIKACLFLFTWIYVIFNSIKSMFNVLKSRDKIYYMEVPLECIYGKNHKLEDHVYFIRTIGVKTYKVFSEYVESGTLYVQGNYMFLWIDG